MNRSSKPGLSVSLGSDHLHAILRVYKIRNDTLIQLVQHWAEPRDRDAIIDALDELAAVVTSPAREGELDWALLQVEDFAGMDSAQVEVSIPDVRRLADELRVVARKLLRFGRRVPGQRGAA